MLLFLVCLKQPPSISDTPRLASGNSERGIPLKSPIRKSKTAGLSWYYSRIAL